MTRSDSRHVARARAIACALAMFLLFPAALALSGCVASQDSKSAEESTGTEASRSPGQVPGLGESGRVADSPTDDAAAVQEFMRILSENHEEYNAVLGVDHIEAVSRDDWTGQIFVVVLDVIEPRPAKILGYEVTIITGSKVIYQMAD